jgi:hypothetical protein
MIIGVDRSGDESNFPIVYAAVRYSDSKAIESFRKYLRKTRAGKSLKANLLLDRDLKKFESLFKGKVNYYVVTAKEYDKFRKRNAKVKSPEQKYSFECYLKILRSLVKEGDEIIMCKEFDERSMKDIAHKLKHRLKRSLRINLTHRSEAVIVADLLAGAKRRELR